MNHDELTYKVFDWLRFPLIVFVVYIHSFGKPIDFSAIDFSHLMPIDYYNLFRVSISHALTHIAVPMFFFISGFLFFNKLQNWNSSVYLDKLKRRIKTLLIPFILWNTIKILFEIQSLARHDGIGSVWNFIEENNYFALYWNCMQWNLERIDWLGILTPSSSPYLVSLWYLRDLMVIMVLSPLIYYLFKFAKIWGWLLLFISYISLVGFKIPGFSATAWFFFGTGAYFNLNKINPTSFSCRYKYFIYGLAIVLCLIVALYDGQNTHIGNLIYPFYIIIGSIAMFNLATSFVKKGFLIPKILIQSTFFVYLAHTIKITRISRYVMSKIFVSENAVSLSISYFLAPLLTVTICVLLYLSMRKYLPKLCDVLTGAR